MGAESDDPARPLTFKYELYARAYAACEAAGSVRMA